MSTWNRNAESLFRGKAIDASGTVVGNWHLVKAPSELAFFTRMTSAGNPTLAISIDYSIFEPGNDVISPDDAYNTVALIASFTTVWDGDDTGAIFTYTARPTGLPIHALVAIRARAVESSAVAVTALDVLMVKETRA